MSLPANTTAIGRRTNHDRFHTAEAHKVVDAVIEAINEGLAADGKVIIPGFGSFEVRTRTARVGRNPRTGEQIKIKASKVPAFKPGKAMKDIVNRKKK